VREAARTTKLEHHASGSLAADRSTHWRTLSVVPDSESYPGPTALGNEWGWQPHLVQTQCLKTLAKRRPQGPTKHRSAIGKTKFRNSATPRRPTRSLHVLNHMQPSGLYLLKPKTFGTETGYVFLEAKNQLLFRYPSPSLLTTSISCPNTRNLDAEWRSTLKFPFFPDLKTVQIYIGYIQGVPGGMWNTSGECSLC